MVVNVKCRGEPNFKQFEFKPNSQFKEVFGESKISISFITKKVLAGYDDYPFWLATP